MESGNNLNTDIINDNTDVEVATGLESLMEDESESMAAFVAHALRKQKAREKITQEEKHSVSEMPYRQQRKRIEQNLGHEKLSFGEVIGKYNGLFTFLNENTVPDPNIEQKYQAITGQKEKLQFILDLPLVDKVKLFCSDNFGYANYDNFMHRLQFQQDLINGTAMVWTDRWWDDEQGEYVDVQEPLDPDLANPADISLELERASLRSAMIGTPEYGAYKMALDFAHSWNYRTTSDFPKIKGYWSGIYKNSDGSSIGGLAVHNR